MDQILLSICLNDPIRMLSRNNITCNGCIVDLYMMILQTEGILAIKEMLDSLEIKHIDSSEAETIARLSRLVMKNYYFVMMVNSISL